MTSTDVILIGAGPIGLEMAVALQDAGVDYLHLEAQQVAQTISWYPRQVRFFSSPERIAICGVPLMTADQSKATREEYLAYLLGIVQQFQLQIRAYERVTRIERQEILGAEQEVAGGPFLVETQRADGPHQYRAEKIILAVGDMHRPRRLTFPTLPQVPGEDLPHVNHYFVEPHPYVGQNLLVVGGRNSAVEAAIRCHRAGARVSLSYRRDQLDSSIKYWLKPEIEWLIKTGAIAYYPSTVPTRITPTTVTLTSTQDGQLQDPARADSLDVRTDFVLLLIGYEQDKTLMQMAGVELVGPNQAPQVNPLTMETNVPGFYVAGTAAAGTQTRFKLFIENCHSHVVRILRHLTEQDPQHINPLAYTRLDEHPLAAES